jgi:hypothetical protein
MAYKRDFTKRQKRFLYARGICGGKKRKKKR